MSLASDLGPTDRSTARTYERTDELTKMRAELRGNLMLLNACASEEPDSDEVSTSWDGGWA